MQFKKYSFPISLKTVVFPLSLLLTQQFRYLDYKSFPSVAKGALSWDKFTLYEANEFIGTMGAMIDIRSALNFDFLLHKADD